MTPMKLCVYVIAYPHRSQTGDLHRILVLAYRSARSGKLRVGYIHYITSHPMYQRSTFQIE